MNGLRLLLALLFTLILQLAVVERMAIFGVRPDLTLLVLVLLSLRRGPLVGTLAGFVIGLLQDILVPQTLGMNTFAKSIVGYVLGKSSQNLLLEGPPLHLGLIALSVLLHDLIFLLLSTHLDLPRFFTVYFTHAIPTAIYTAVVGLLVLGVVAAANLRSSSNWGEHEGTRRG